MNNAILEIRKSRKHIQREINEALEKVLRLEEQIENIKGHVVKKEELLDEYDTALELLEGRRSEDQVS